MRALSHREWDGIPVTKNVVVPDWIFTALKKAVTVLGWKSISLTLDLLESDEFFAGSEDGYNMSVICRWRNNSWTIMGGCGYGSEVFITPVSVMIKSCGGHYFRIDEDPMTEELVYAVDNVRSESSWGDDKPSFTGIEVPMLTYANRISRIAV